MADDSFVDQHPVTTVSLGTAAGWLVVGGLKGALAGTGFGLALLLGLSFIQKRAKAAAAAATPIAGTGPVASPSPSDGANDAGGITPIDGAGGAAPGGMHIGVRRNPPRVGVHVGGHRPVASKVGQVGAFVFNPHDPTRVQ